MALVANYSSSSEDEDEDSDQEQEEKKKVNGFPDTSAEKVKEAEENEDDNNEKGESLISDDDDDFQGAPGLLDEVEDDIPGLGTSSSSSSFFASLPTTTSSLEVKKDFVDVEEDLSTIPKAKESEKASAPLPNKASAGLKRKKKGPVRIVLPFLSDFGDAEDDGEEVKKVKVAASSAGSALLSLLPAPKNAGPSKEAGGGGRLLVPNSVARKANPPLPMPKRVAAAAAVMAASSASSLAPRRPQENKVPDNPSDSSDDDDDDSVTPFFSLEPDKVIPTFSSPASTSVRVTANPMAVGPSEEDDYLHPLPSRSGPSSSSWHHQHGQTSSSSSSLAVGPAKPEFLPQSSYPEPEDLMANEEALNRLAGKHALKNKEDFSFVEVKGSSLTADPREWLTKALTEDDPDKPGPRCTVKGQTRKKHQITYLAAMAKENEHKLKEQWSRNAASKKAAGAKYGF